MGGPHSAELCAVHTGHSGLCPQGHGKVGKREENHQEIVSGRKKEAARVDKTEKGAQASSSTFQVGISDSRVSSGVTSGKKSWPKDSGTDVSRGSRC